MLHKLPFEFQSVAMKSNRNKNCVQTHEDRTVPQNKDHGCIFPRYSIVYLRRGAVQTSFLKNIAHKLLQKQRKCQ